jgi:biotin transport system substrate-specific component
LGLPVLAGGAGGLAVLLGPRGGYVLGFILSAWVTGTLVERGFARGRLRALGTFAIGLLAVYAPALPWLSQFTGVEAAFGLGFFPFIPGDLLKLVAVSLVWAGLERRFQRP